MPRKRNKELPIDIRQILIIAVFAVVIVVLASAVWGIAKKESVARHAVRDREAELAALELRRAAFEANVAELSTTRGQEAALRKSHGVAKPGEEVIIVVPAEEMPEEPKISLWKRFLGWFGIW